ncbi:MAG: TadE/TadG family type IV pilus assembly protein [Acidimicrobiales bacterium]
MKQDHHIQGIEARTSGSRRRMGNRPTGNETGAGLAEFALVLPILILIVFGIIEFGIAFNRAQAIEAAAREGARLASISTSTQGDITARVNATLAGIPLQNPANVAIAPGGCAGREGDPVTVTVTTQHALRIPLLPLPAVNLTGQAVFRCEA